MWYWNSSRKCLMKLFTGSAAASPSSQIVRPAMLSETDSNTSRSSCLPSPCSMRLTIRHSQPDLEVARTLDVARHRENLRAAVVGTAEIENCLSAVVQNPWHGREGLGIVDRRRFAVEAVACGKRRLEPRQPLLAFERLEERGLLAADIRAVAVMVVQMKGETAAKNVVTEEARPVCFLQRFLTALVFIPDLAVDIVVTALAAHGVGGDRHALDQDMRVVAQDVPILERSRFALIGIADEILLARVLL